MPNPVFNEEYKKKIKEFNGKEVEITIPAFLEIVFQVASSCLKQSNLVADSENDNALWLKGNTRL